MLIIVRGCDCGGSEGDDVGTWRAASLQLFREYLFLWRNPFFGGE